MWGSRPASAIGGGEHRQQVRAPGRLCSQMAEWLRSPQDWLAGWLAGWAIHSFSQRFPGVRNESGADQTRPASAFPARRAAGGEGSARRQPRRHCGSAHPVPGAVWCFTGIISLPPDRPTTQELCGPAERRGRARGAPPPRLRRGRDSYRPGVPAAAEGRWRRDTGSRLPRRAAAPRDGKRRLSGRTSPGAAAGSGRRGPGLGAGGTRRPGRRADQRQA